MSQTRVGDEEFTEPPALTVCNDGALDDKGIEAPKPLLSLMEMRKLKPAGSYNTEDHLSPAFSSLELLTRSHEKADCISKADSTPTQYFL